MKHSIPLAIVFVTLGVSACDRPAPTTPTTVVVPVPGPPGPTGDKEKTGDTILIVLPAPTQ